MADVTPMPTPHAHRTKRRTLYEAAAGALPAPLGTMLQEARATAQHLVRWQSRNLVHTLPSGLGVRIEGASEWCVYNEVFADGQYDRPIRAAIERRPLAPLVLDLGAHVGFFTLRFADLWKRAHPERPFRVVCVEGSPRAWQRLAGHVGQRDLRAHCTAVRGLVGARDGYGRISRSIRSSLNSTIAGAGLFRSAVVPYVDVESLVARDERVALLKCDIEGAEQAFLETYPRLLARVEAAVFELHSALCDVPRCRDLLAAAGLTERALLDVFDDHCTIELFERRTGGRAPGGVAA